MAKLTPWLSKVFPSWSAKREWSRFQATEMRHATKIMEAIPAFARDTDEKAWTDMTGVGRKSGYSEQQFTDMRKQARELAIINPSARGLLGAMTRFIIGKECKIIPVDDKVKEYWDAFVDANSFDLMKKRCVLRTLRDGEIFLRFFNQDPKSQDPDLIGQALPPLVRFVDTNEIKDHLNRHTFGIECDPEDVAKPLNYFRSYWRRGVEVHEEIPVEEMLHFKIMCDENEKRGYTWLIGIAKYIISYDRWLEDRIAINHIRTLFNLIGKPSGMTPSNFAQQIPSAKVQGGGDTINKKMPKSGTVLISQGIDYEFKNLQMNAADTATDGRHIERQICKATMLMEGVVTGDFSNQNYASSLVAESPMVKSIEEEQDTFGTFFKQLAARVIAHGKASNFIPRGADETVNVSFASLVHRDLKADTEAYVIQMGSGVVSLQTITGLLGYDFHKEQDLIRDEEKQEDKRAKERDGVLNDQDEGNPNGKEKDNARRTRANQT